jgi:hypothetical protein
MAARSITFLALAALMLAVTASGGAAASPPRTPILGVVPHASDLLTSAPFALSRAIGAAGPNTLTFDASYQTDINRYFTDVAHDSGGNANVYSVGTQYSDGSGPVQYQSTFGGSYVDRDPFPATNGCGDGLDAYCLTDQQLQTEIQTVLTAKGWHGGLDHIFFLMTPNGVGSCFDSFNTQCSTTAFCAYHSAFTDSNGEDVIYANEPYEGPPGGCTDPTQGFPNDADADTTINTISHEHNESITDPLGTGWFTSDGNQNEDGDLCAYGFGNALGGTEGVDAYNQVINTHHYDLQQEWSNGKTGVKTGCLQYLGDPNPSPPCANLPGPCNGPLDPHGGPVMHTNTTYAIYWLPTAGLKSAPVVTGTAAVNGTLRTSAGSWSGAPSSYAYQWQRCSSTGTGCVAISGATATSYKLTAADAGYVVRSTVRATNVNGASSPAASTGAPLVVDVPAATKAPHISGRARVGKKLSGSRGSWTYSPTGYRYQWLRCNAHGGSCSSIHSAAHPTYTLVKRDAGHRLRLRIAATNAAGSKTALSSPSARVAKR